MCTYMLALDFSGFPFNPTYALMANCYLSGVIPNSSSAIGILKTARCTCMMAFLNVGRGFCFGFKSLHSQRDDLFTGLHGMKAQCFSFGMKFRPLGKDQTPKIDLTFSPNCGIIRVSRWRPTFVALPLGNVSVSYPLQRG